MKLYGKRWFGLLLTLALVFVTELLQSPKAPSRRSAAQREQVIMEVGKLLIRSRMARESMKQQYPV